MFLVTACRLMLQRLPSPRLDKKTALSRYRHQPPKQRPSLHSTVCPLLRCSLPCAAHMQALCRQRQSAVSKFIEVRFLPHYAMLARYTLSSCLPVCLSVTNRHCTETAKRRIAQTTPCDSPGTLVYCCRKSKRNSDGAIFNRGAK